MGRTRGTGGFGPASLTHLEIKAWYQNMRIDPWPTSWEIKNLLTIDSEYMKCQAEKAEAASKKTGA